MDRPDNIDPSGIYVTLTGPGLLKDRSGWAVPFEWESDPSLVEIMDNHKRRNCNSHDTIKRIIFEDGTDAIVHTSWFLEKV